MTRAETKSFIASTPDAPQHSTANGERTAKHAALDVLNKAAPNNPALN
jgi:hypothetical protein